MPILTAIITLFTTGFRLAFLGGAVVGALAIVALHLTGHMSWLAGLGVVAELPWTIQLLFGVAVPAWLCETFFGGSDYE